MKLITQPNSWSCLATSFAMVAGTSVEDVDSFVPYDSSEILYPELPSNINRRGHGLNHMLHYMLVRGFAVTPLIRNLTQGPAGYSEISTRFKLEPEVVLEFMKAYDGVLVGHLPTGTGHAVAWNHQESLVYDPVGQMVDLSACPLRLETFFLCSPLNKHPSCLET